MSSALRRYLLEGGTMLGRLVWGGLQESREYQVCTSKQQKMNEIKKLEGRIITKDDFLLKDILRFTFSIY
jgi:hypothetical protein